MIKEPTTTSKHNHDSDPSVLEHKNLEYDLYSATQIADMFNVGYDTIRRVAEKFDIEGKKTQFKCGKTGKGYDPFEINQIRDELYNRNLIKRKPENRLYSVEDIADMFSISGETITAIANTLDLESERVRFVRVPGKAYDSWQVNQIRDELYRRNLIERKPEDAVYPASDIGKMLSVTNKTIARIAIELGLDGEQQVRFGKHRTTLGTGYDSWQVNQIRDELIRKGHIKQ